MNTNMKRVISGIAALGIALSGMALGASSAWAGEGEGLAADDVKIAEDAQGTITIKGGAIKHTFNGYRLGYLASIAYDDIDDTAGLNNLSMTGYTLETNPTYLTQIDNVLGAITVNGETLLAKYKADKNYCGTECNGGAPIAGEGDLNSPNPLGWFFENYGEGYEDTANWGGSKTGAASDAADASILRQFATRVSAELGKTGAPAATYSGNAALKSDTGEGHGNEVSQGFYLLRDVTDIAAGGDTKDDTNKETQSAPILVSTTYKITVKDKDGASKDLTFTVDAGSKTLGVVDLKNSAPTITKEVVKPTADSTEENPKYEAQNQPDYAVGDTVYYKLTATLPYYTGYATPGRVYKITDTASKGLTVGNDAVVSVKVTAVDGSKDPEQNLAVTTDYTVKTETSADTVAEAYKGGKTTTIDFSNYVNRNDKSVSAGENGKILEGGTITVIFKATLNNNALISDKNNIKANPNKDSLTYSNEPENVQETHTTPGDVVNVYTYRFRLHKTDKTGEALPGATFHVSAPDNANKWLAWNSENSKWTYADNEDEATNFTSDENGNVVGEDNVNLDRLDSGTYTVKEIEAPTGYTQAFLPTFSFTITPTMGNEADGHKTITDVTFSNADGKDKAYVTKSAAIADGADQKAWQYTIYNAKNLTELPMTGGAGLVAVIAAGVLLAGAGVAAAVRSRKSNSRAVRI